MAVAHARNAKWQSPRTGPKGAKRIFGFQTGDIVKAHVNKGNKAGKSVGKVSVRSSGYFDIQTFDTNDLVQGINCKLIQRIDGYSYPIGRIFS